MFAPRIDFSVGFLVDLFNLLTKRCANTSRYRDTFSWLTTKSKAADVAIQIDVVTIGFDGLDKKPFFAVHLLGVRIGMCIGIIIIAAALEMWKVADGKLGSMFPL